MKKTVFHGMFEPGEIPCSYCGLEFIHDVRGIRGRCSFFCSDKCAATVKEMARIRDAKLWTKIEPGKPVPDIEDPMADRLEAVLDEEDD